MTSAILRRFALGATVALAIGLAGCAPGASTQAQVNHTHPALWEAHDSNTTIYFFGTVHAMKKGVNWHFPALDKALAASQTLYMEAANINPATVRPLVLRYGIDRTHSLSDKLSPKEQKLLQQAVKQLNLPGGMLAINMMKPWLAAITIAATPIIKAGYDPKLGVDKQLQKQFEKAGKTVKGFETAKEQLMFMANLPESLQLKFLQRNLQDYSKAKTQVAQIVKMWRHGRVKKLGNLMVTELKNGSPKLYKVLILNRNQNWAQQIAKLMKNATGTIFVAVGSGHLAGPDRLQVQLKKRGIQTTRIND